MLETLNSVALSLSLSPALALIVILGLLLMLLLLLVLLFLKSGANRAQWEALLAMNSRQLREEITEVLDDAQQALADHVSQKALDMERALNVRIDQVNAQTRKEQVQGLNQLSNQVISSLGKNSENMLNFSRAQSEQVDRLAKVLSENLSKVSSTVEQNLRSLQQSNEQKLEKIRETVDEKLQSVLQQRVSESFRLVSDRLNEVYAGLGEMKKLAQDVGGLKQVLTNVKSRGMFGEVQLEALLQQYFTVDQYGKNVHPVPESSLVVEFAVKMPGAHQEVCWLPIDAKFPVEDYQRLQQAQEVADSQAVLSAREALRQRLLSEGKEIARYICPPNTTDFAILFLPSEGLYAEVLSLAGLTERLFTQYHVYIMGPSTLASALCAYRAGFQTLAIEKRSAEVRHILGGVKVEFEKFATTLVKLKKHLEAASNTVNDAQIRTRKMSSHLKEVEANTDIEKKLKLSDSQESSLPEIPS